MTSLEDALKEWERLAKAATPDGWVRGGDITCECGSSNNCWHCFDKQAEIFPKGDHAGPIATVAQNDFDNATYIAYSDPAFALSLIAQVRERLAPKLPVEGELPELDIRDEDHARYDAEWETRWDGYPVDAICAELYCRERQLLASQARERALEAEVERLREGLRVAGLELEQKNASNRAAAGVAKRSLARAEAAETALATSQAELEKMRSLADRATEGMEQAQKRAETSQADTRAECLAAVRAAKVENPEGNLIRAKINVGVERAVNRILALPETGR